MPPSRLEFPIDQLLAGEHRALARAITEVENETRLGDVILKAVHHCPEKAAVVGITGPPGVGKSTLIDALTSEFRSRNLRIGILAIDPTSPRTGGAILGDRIRMDRHTNDRQVFVRSLASRGRLGGLSPTIARVIRVMDAGGPDVIIVETVGAGQLDVSITEVAHTNVVLCAPGLGDEIQTIKAGILESADILVVNKMDNPLAQNTVQQLHAMLALRGPDRPRVAVISTVASTGRGIPILADALQEHAARRGIGKAVIDPDRRLRSEIADAAARLVRRHIETARDPRIEALCRQIVQTELGIDAAAARFLGPALFPNAD